MEVIKNILAIGCSICVISGIHNVAFASSDIKVYIDDERIEFGVEPELINDRTMVPMRKIFECLGAEVEWNGRDKSISSTCGYLDIEMQIDNREMSVNEREITLDAAPIIKDDRTLVPLRAVAEAFSADVNWDQRTKTVDIITPYPENKDKTANEEFDPYHIRTSNGEYEYFDFEIDGSILTLTGMTMDEKIEQINLSVIDFEYAPEDVFAGEEFELFIDLDEYDIEDRGGLYISVQRKGDDRFWGYIYDSIYISRTGNRYRFEEPLVLDNNIEQVSEWENPIAYIDPDIDAEIVELSDEICRMADDDYERVLLIHDWVAENIYYDYDYYYDKSSDINYSALGVYKSGRSVCEGYANLTQALIHAQGIPCKKVSGYALGLSADKDYWTDESASTERTNHAWNRAYVDNRWINLDTTWDSANKYENGEYIYGGCDSHLYFDITDIFFSYDHKYM